MYKSEAKGSFAYTYEEMLFFIESELAPGSERLTLEYPGDSQFPDEVVVKDTEQTESISFGGSDVIGGTAPDRHYWHGLDHYVNSHANGDSRLRSTLPAAVNIHGSEVVPIERHVAERARQGLTLEAMHGGADFIVGGQLVTGQFAGLVDILVKEEGHSDFGDYFYVPCGMRNGDELYAALRLCFIADLLQNMQGVLPRELLLFHNQKGPESLDTEKYIQYFRALKYRFIASRNLFSKEGPAQATGLDYMGTHGSGLEAGMAAQGNGGHTWSLASALDELLKMRNPAARREASPAVAPSAVKLVEKQYGAIVDTNGVAMAKQDNGAANGENPASREPVTSRRESRWSWHAAEASS